MISSVSPLLLSSTPAVGSLCSDWDTPNSQGYGRSSNDRELGSHHISLRQGHRRGRSRVRPPCYPFAGSCTETSVISARNVIAAILKRLAHRSSNVQLYTLSLAESLEKNCTIELHREMASKAFTQGLEKLISDRVSASVLLLTAPLL